MMKRVLAIACMMLATMSMAAQNKTAMMTNPVIFADVPDLDIIRVDDAYYMVSTTMHFAPGCGIMKSKDLVNWEIVNYAYDELDEGDNFRLLNGKSEYSQGSWAANLRYDRYEKMFYMIMTCNTTGKTYFYVTDDIENGKWHRSTTDKCYDPGLLFEDTGKEMKKYVLHPADTFDDHAMYLREISVDKDWNVTVGERHKVIDYANLENPARGLRAEGYHGYKIGDWYYIFMIQGCDGQRQEIVWRSKHLLNGQWEGRMVFGGEMTDEQGDEFKPYKTARSKSRFGARWENSILGDRTHGWLKPVWQWNHIPDMNGWSLTERKGWLRLKATSVTKSIREARNTLTQRAFGPTCTGEVLLDASRLQDGDYAGISAFQNRYGFVGVKRENGQLYIVMQRAMEKGDAVGKEIESLPLQQEGRVSLRVTMDFTNLTDKATFAYSLDGKQWQPIGDTLQMYYDWPDFCGYRFALFHFATKQVGGHADFDYFRVAD